MQAPFLLLMPSYNQSRYIVDAVRSVLAQDDANWELWIVDNSSDDTPAVMRQFIDPRIRFHHIARRMDPGSCLNWMLERARGRDFSYIHTDNNLHPAYVRRMREALSGHPLALAYCDMRAIDADGRYTNVYRRGRFDLPRLLSVDSLGVPFAATLELAKQVGGFSECDYADDVKFCVSSYGLAEYIYVPQAILDYRLHGASRTENAGGGERMQCLFAGLMPRIVPVLEQRGLRPVEAMAAAIEQGLDDLDLLIEDTWHRKFSGKFAPWWKGQPRCGDFFFAGLLDLPEFTAEFGRPKLGAVAPTGGRGMSLWTVWVLRAYFARGNRDVRRQLRYVRDRLVTWAAMALGSPVHEKQRIRVRSADFRTIWAARQLEIALGWTPVIDGELGTLTWLRWERAIGDEPLLDCAARPQLLRA